MNIGTFYALRDLLVTEAQLEGGRVIVKEKMFIFIYIVTRGALNRDTTERFARLTNTISRYVKEL